MFIQEPRYKCSKQQSRQNWENACKYRNIKCLISANSEGSRGVASFWKQPFLDLHSDVVIEQLIEDTAQLSTIAIAGMEIKICNLCAPNNDRGRTRAQMNSHASEKISFSLSWTTVGHSPTFNMSLPSMPTMSDRFQYCFYNYLPR
jgi:hypothetical protein